MPGEDLEDRELIHRLSAGDRDALDPLLRRHAAAVLRHAGTFRGAASVRTWLFALARHAALKAVRPNPSTPSAEADAPLLDLGLAAGWGETTPEALLAREEESALVTLALARLPAEDREILHLRDLEGLSGEEAAEVLGLSLAAMKSRLHRARLRLLAEVRTLTRGGARA